MREPWLKAAQVTWLAAVLLLLVAIALGLVAFYHRLNTLCTPPACDVAELSPENIRLLANLGISTGLYRAVILGQAISIVLMSVIVAIIIAWRRRDDWFALWVAFVVVANAGTLTNTYRQLAMMQPENRPVAALLESLSLASLLSLFFLFPSGRFVPRWTWPIPLLYLVLTFVWLFTPQSAHQPLYQIESAVLPSLWLGLFLIPFLSGVLSQVYRYQRVSSQSQRQQAKWVAIFGLTGTILVALLFAALIMVWLVNPERGPFTFVLLGMVALPFQYFFPLSLAFSILRYRLFDIDIIIRQTLVYSLLSALLALLYFASVVVMQSIFRAITGQTTQFVIVFSTLAIAFLFTPLRRRVQATIDLRFYRHKYNAEKALTAFGAIVRDEVDLDNLTTELLRVVEETMQPAHLSLWLQNQGQNYRLED
jgi:hypothetical protein